MPSYEIDAGKLTAKAQKKLAECKQQGVPAHAAAGRARAAWRKAEEALDDWSALDDAWGKTKQALRLVTPEGDLNTRERAEAQWAQTLPRWRARVRVRSCRRPARRGRTGSPEVRRSGDPASAEAEPAAVTVTATVTATATVTEPPRSRGAAASCAGPL